MEDFNLFAKNSMQYWHWGLDEFFDTDYYELMEVMNAKKPEDRVQDPMKLFNAINGKG
ncbi:hypothetical protein [Oenococcus oeni]|uniref:hypothetical protein n=1 Tax=Oenococcus oeni TaxID=1247 RepID=UPI0015D6647B|nr:hypothetical protein [Oenococcus oeni]